MILSFGEGKGGERGKAGRPPSDEFLPEEKRKETISVRILVDVGKKGRGGGKIFLIRERFPLRKKREKEEKQKS